MNLKNLVFSYSFIYKTNILALVFLSMVSNALAHPDKKSVDGVLNNAFEEESEVEIIEVIGTRLVNRNSIAAKLSTSKFVDSVGENEVASFAGENAAEILFLLPAVSVFGNDETILNRFVTIRGINPDWNSALMNGLNLATPNPEQRAQYFDFFPTNQAKRIEVFKTFSAEDDGGAIGGTINFENRRGLDYETPLFTVTSGIGFTEINDAIHAQKQPFNFDISYAGKLNNKLGVSFSGSFNQRETVQPSTLTYANNRTIPNQYGEDVNIARDYRLVLDEMAVNRINFSAGLDYQFTDITYAWVTIGYNRTDFTKYHYKSDERITSAKYTLEELSNNTGFVTVDESDETNVYGGAHYAEVGSIQTDSRLKYIQAGINHFYNDDLSLEIKSSFSQANEDRIDRYTLFFHEPVKATFFYDKSNLKLPTISFVETDDMTLEQFYDPSKYLLANDQYNNRIFEDKVIDLVTNLNYNTSPGNEGWGYKGGLRFKQTDRGYDYDKHQYNSTSSGAKTFTLASILAEVPDLTYPGLNNKRVPMFGNLGLRNILISTQVRNNDLFTLSTSENNDNSSDYGLKESIFAAFTMAEYQSKSLNGHIGFRYENTKTDGTGFIRINNTWEATTNKKDYAKLLPSIGINYFPLEKVRISASYSKTLGRPGYKHLAPRGESLDLKETGEGYLRRSNPNLKPRVSDNFDLYTDWFIEDGLVSIGIFHKNIANELIYVRSNEKMVFDDKTYDILIYQKVNVQGAFLSGVEFNFIKDFTFLPAPFDGLGVSFNATLTDGGFALPKDHNRENPDYLLQQTDKLANLNLYYSKDKIDANITLSHIGETPKFYDVNNADNDQRELARNTISAKIRYIINENFQVFIAGSNLTSQDYVRVTANNRLYGYRNDGRSYKLGIVYKF